MIMAQPLSSHRTLTVKCHNLPYTHTHTHTHIHTHIYICRLCKPTHRQEASPSSPVRHASSASYESFVSLNWLD